MQVEVYEVGEIDAASGASEYADPVAAERFRALCEKNGLTGQAGLLRADGAKPVVLPFRPMTREEMFAWGTVLPRRTKVETYAGEPMPLRVLETLDRAKETGLFRKFEVWHPAPGNVDPLLVGYLRKESEWSDEPCALARWGESLIPYREVVVRALTIFKQTAAAALRRVIATAQRDLAAAEAIDPAAGIVPTDTSTPYFSGWSA